MKILKYITTAVGATLLAGSALAGPCDDAEPGSYESNVCWLVETRFDEMTTRTAAFLVQALPLIAVFGGVDAMTEADFEILTDLTTVESLDRENCTVTYVTMEERNTIHFNRVNPDVVRWYEEGEVVKYTLTGKGFSSDGRRRITFFSLEATLDEWARAIENLYVEHCAGVESEF